MVTVGELSMSCDICLEQIADGDSTRVHFECRRAYHTPCIDQWLEDNTNCPQCRNPFGDRENWLARSMTVRDYVRVSDHNAARKRRETFFPGCILVGLVIFLVAVQVGSLYVQDWIQRAEWQIPPRHGQC